MDTPLVLGLAVLGLVWATSGVGLCLVGHLPGPRVAAPALVAGGVLTLGAALAAATVGDDAARWLLVSAWGLAIPLSVTAYPRLQWRHPVDLVALVTVVGSGALASVQTRQDAVLQATGVTIASVLVLHTWWKIERLDAVGRRALTWVAVVGSAAVLVGILVTF
ncbi:MAG: hypothetical protein ABIQ61_00790, partial [Ornithinibacter sp.]